MRFYSKVQKQFVDSADQSFYRVHMHQYTGVAIQIILCEMKIENEISICIQEIFKFQKQKTDPSFQLDSSNSEADPVSQACFHASRQIDRWIDRERVKNLKE